MKISKAFHEVLSTLRPLCITFASFVVKNTQVYPVTGWDARRVRRENRCGRCGSGKGRVSAR